MGSEIDDPPFGAFPPTRLQAALIAMFHGTPLGYSRLRRVALRWFREARPGPVDATLFGFKVRFHPHDNQTDAKSALVGPCYNGPESRWLRRHLPEGGTFVDVGANMGFFSLLAATRRARILAIEPLPDMFRRLQQNLTRNGIDAVALNVAAGASNGTVSMAPDPLDRGSSHVVEAAHATLTVPQRRLLDVVRKAGFDGIDLLKIDVEGYEDRVLTPFFASAPPALWPRALIMEDSARSSWADDIVATLPRLGYTRRARNRGNALWLRRRDHLGER